MPRRSKGDTGSVRLDYTNEVGQDLRQLQQYYGIANAKDLVRFLILQEHRRILSSAFKQKEAPEAKE